MLKALPLNHVSTVHIAGGSWLSAGAGGEMRWLDDHLHPVPDMVFSMLEELAALTLQPLTVILERDGAYPSINELLLELQLARTALCRGRKRQSQMLNRSSVSLEKIGAGGRSARLESLLARIYVDEKLRTKFMAEPEEFIRREQLSDEDAVAIASIDRIGLAMASRSFARKRQLKRARQH